MDSARTICMLFICALAVSVCQGQEKKLVLLTSQLRDDDYDTRVAAALKLGLMEEDAEAAIPALIAALADDATQMRMAVAQAIGSICAGLVSTGKDGSAPVSALIEALQSEIDPQVRVEIVLSLGKSNETDKTVAALAAAIEKDKIAVRQAAISSLGQLANSALQKIVPILLKAFQDRDPRIRYAVVSAFANIRPQSRQIAEALVATLQSPNSEMKLAAIEALDSRGEHTPLAIPALIEALQERDNRVRYAAIRTLGYLKKQAAPATAALISGSLTDPNPTIRLQTEITLMRIGKEAVPLLIKALDHDDEQKRHQAIRVMAQIGKDAGAAGEKIIALALASNDERFLSYAVAALKSFDQTPQYLPLLATALQQKDANTRANAALCLSALKADATVIPHLLKLLADDDVRCRLYSMRAIGSLQDKAIAAVPELIKILTTEKDEKEWIYAIDALGKIGSPAASAVPQLIKIIGTKSQGIDITTMRVIGEIGEAAHQAIPLLTSIVDKADNRFRVYHAYTALVKIGKKSLPSLRQFLQHPNSRVKLYAIQGLGKIGNHEDIANLENIIESETSVALRRAAAKVVAKLQRDWEREQEK